MEQRGELSEVIVLSLFEEISPGNVFSEEIFLWIYVFLSLSHDFGHLFCLALDPLCHSFLKIWMVDLAVVLVVAVKLYGQEAAVNQLSAAAAVIKAVAESAIVV